MTIEEFRELHTASPFQPFRLHLADGRSIDVDQPRHAMQARRGTMVYVAKPAAGVEIIDLMLVVSASVDVTRRDRKRSNGN